MGGKFFRKKQSAQKVVQQSRKQLRKEKRLKKKVKKNEYFQNRNKQDKIETTKKSANNSTKLSDSELKTFKQSGGTAKHVTSDGAPDIRPLKVVDVLKEQEKEREKETKRKLKLQRQMSLQRKKQLKEANRDEDKVIKKLEKQLKLNKRKSKSVPKSFVDEGLDYLLEVCDSEKLQGVARAEMNLQESGSEFEDDFAVVTGRKKVTTKETRLKDEEEVSDSESGDTSKSEGFSDSDEGEGDGLEEGKKKLSSKKNSTYSDTFKKKNDETEDSEYSSGDLGEDVELFSDDDSIDGASKTVLKNKQTKHTPVNKKQKKVVKKNVTFAEETVTQSIDESENTDSNSDLESESEDSIGDEDCEKKILLKNRKRNIYFSDDEESRSSKKMKTIIKDSKSCEEEAEELWEDIYGRTRDKEGNVVKATSGKYVPPHLRAEISSEDAKRAEELSRLRKQLKGLINRLAESNMHSISNQIDDLYMKNSRNDMNETLSALIFESLITRALTSERLVMEHALLVAILHANVGMEIGAHFLQSAVKKFDVMYSAGQDVEDKSLDNVVLIISHLYNFKVFNAVLMYNILEKLADTFGEKEVELILLVLRNVGFSLRKDDPLALKDLILRLQKKANESGELRNHTRVRFMLDTLLAVKNNNMAKIPQYDPSYSEHLKKLIKTMIRKGKYLTEMKITLDDLLKVEERGRWWIVGSAWTGNTNPVSNVQNNSKTDEYSGTILELARKQRMNTDTRRNIFCILMSAEDFMDAFEKVLRLGLKAGQEQEIVHVLIHCLLQEKVFNPYYAHLANQLCITDRKHQLTIQYNVWDRLKELSDLGTTQITNLAKFLAYLFLEKSLPISVLKVVQFSDMDKACVKLMRQLLLTTLLHDCQDTMTAVFARVSRPPKLRMFRESLRLFLYHFVLRNVKDESDEAVKLRERVKLAEAALTSVDTSKLVS